MAVPKRKLSKARTARRRAANWRLEAPTLVRCARCRSLKLPHHVCPTCGTYRGRDILHLED
ncbi:MAG: 50S ribosomal protein L32 [Firmicutes bacterium]|nr:50S ribosomal protein L32 [Bacillota bacterium]